MAKITVVVVDDHPLFRQGVVDAFSLEKDLKVLGQAASGNEALAMIKIPEKIQVQKNIPEALSLTVDSNKIMRVFINIIKNAADAMPNGGTLKIQTNNLHLDELHACQIPELPAGRYVLLSVSDSGIGMDAETRSKI